MGLDKAWGFVQCMDFVMFSVHVMELLGLCMLGRLGFRAFGGVT